MIYAITCSLLELTPANLLAYVEQVFSFGFGPIVTALCACFCA